MLSACRDITALNISQVYGFFPGYTGWWDLEKFCSTFFYPSLALEGIFGTENQEAAKKTIRNKTVLS